MSKSKQNMKPWQLAQRQSLDLEQKIALSKIRIVEWVEAWDYNVYVSVSGGKDSSVLLNLVRQVYPKCPAVFVDTGVEYPEIRRFAKSQPNVTVLKPKMHFPQVIRIYGYPVISKRVSRYVQDVRGDSGHNNVATRTLRRTGYTLDGTYRPNFKLPKKWKFLISAPFKISDRCCEVLKEEPLDKYVKETGRKPITGEMAADSQTRRAVYLQHGCNAFGQDQPRSRPMGFWTNQDVLRYIEEKKLPYCSDVYGEIVEENGVLKCTKAAHTGCMFCGFGAQRRDYDRFEELRIAHPKLYKYGMERLGLRTVLDYIRANVPRTAL